MLNELNTRQVLIVEDNTVLHSSTMGRAIDRLADALEERDIAVLSAASYCEAEPLVMTNMDIDCFLISSDMMLEADAKEQYADQQLDDAAAAQAAAERRTADLDRREAGISAKQRQQDEREKEFQKREDSLDAQRVVLEERERAVAERERKNQELIQRGRRAQAEDLSDGIQPADHIEEHPERRLPNTDYYG